MAEVLVIDAHPASRKILITLLSDDKHNLFIATDAIQALEIVRKEKLNLIIGDILLPNSGNYELINILHSHSASSRTPVIFFSANCYQPEFMLLAKASGVVDTVIEITTSPAELVKQIADTISRHQKIKIEEEYILERQIKFAYVARDSWIREAGYMLSHELSQPLMVINAYASGCIQRMKRKDYDNNQIIDAMKTVNYHVDLASKIIQRIKDGVYKNKVHYEKINIHHVIKNAVSLLAYEFQHFPFAIEYEFTEGLPLIEIDEAQIKLVIFCLLQNGVEEMFIAKTKQPRVIIKTKQMNDTTIAVSIKDKGRGIASQIQNKLFNFCFTTKGKNIGMSLATCKNIIEAHDGSITVQSSPEDGACFTFILPIIH